VLGDCSTVIVLASEAPQSEQAPDGRPGLGKHGEADLTIAEYIARLDAGLSQSRVADMCRAGAFPDTVEADGTVIRGAYRDGRPWKITLAGIHERQRRAPAAWVEQRDGQPQPPSGVTVRGGSIASSTAPAADPAEGRTRSARLDQRPLTGLQATVR
jgi:hypothetical protein